MNNYQYTNLQHITYVWGDISGLLLFIIGHNAYRQPTKH